MASAVKTPDDPDWCEACSDEDVGPCPYCKYRPFIEAVKRGNLAVELARAMGVDPERVSWKMWSERQMGLHFKVHVQGPVGKEANHAFWNAIAKREEMVRGQVGIGIDDSVSLEAWRGFPSYSHTLLAHGDASYVSKTWEIVQR